MACAQTDKCDVRRACVAWPNADGLWLQGIALSQCVEGGSAPTVSIGGRLVGGAAPCMIVAEAGVNHNGCVSRAMALVDAAVDARADAIKFQMFRARELATATAPTAAYQTHNTANRTQREMLESLELDDGAWERLSAHCQQRAISLVVTPFGDSSVTRLATMDVLAIKLASTDLMNRSLQQAAASLGRPLIVSTGASTATEISAAVHYLCSIGVVNRLVLLHCISCYPTPIEAANLRAVGTMSAQFDLPVGFSDHTTSTQVGGWAVAAGACLLEKHFTLDRNDNGPDHAMSLAPNQFRQYVAQVREAEAALGRGVLGATQVEDEVRRVARRSVVATARIPAGTVLTASLLTAKRPGSGIAPASLDQLIGRRATQDIPQDSMLAWDMVE